VPLYRVREARVRVVAVRDRTDAQEDVDDGRVAEQEPRTDGVAYLKAL
jgi:hypothetical protein